MAGFSRLTRIQRITIILFVIVVTNWLMVWATGYSIIGGDLLTLFFIIALGLFALSCVRPLIRIALWRVRNRLFVTYFLIGALPTALLIIFFSIGFYILIGQTAAFMLRSELDRRFNRMETAVQQLARDISNGTERSAPGASENVLIRVGDRLSSIPDQAPIQQFPPWSKPGFRGVVRGIGKTAFIATHAGAVKGNRRVDVFAYDTLSGVTLVGLLPGIVSTQLIFSDDVRFPADRADPDPDFSSVDSAHVVALPARRGLWDFNVQWGFLLEVWRLTNDRPGQGLVILSSRLSLIVPYLFSTLGSQARAFGLVLFGIAATFVLVELVAVISSAQLTRTLTRTIHDLYEGTKKVEVGDFSHRIPIRTNDQLSELATSFNSMTRHIGRLIIESKEKEKLEAELEIARQVQTQLFPKAVPRLSTLELAGLCNPARVVSGDYYDFIPLDSQRVALVIADISGKGISAALLMASVQSSLHAQLTLAANSIVSTAVLAGRLNRQLFENTPAEKYATFYCGVYDDQTGRLCYTNAGHLAPILIREGKASRLEANGMVVGMFADSSYQQNVIDLQSGDLLTAYTDGITESEDARGEPFGDQRLIEILIRESARPLDEILQIVTQTVRAWAFDLEDQDDTTMLLARRL